MSKVTEWEYLDKEINAKFQFRRNPSNGKVLTTYTIRYRSDNHKENNGSGLSLGTVDKKFFEETRAFLYKLWELSNSNSEEYFIENATCVFQKKRRFVEMKVPVKLANEFEEIINRYLGE